MTEFLNPLLDWVALHPHLAGLAVCLLVFSESLAGVGLVVPGALTMFGVGALIAAGALGFWSTYAWAVSGAVLGDGLSYWLGRHYHQRVRSLWPFSRHPDWLDTGQTFFHRHGGKSVFLGRFIGPIRPVIPLVAGMLDMPPARFYLVNLLSALGWALVYLLPGIAFGASLTLAAQVAGRLALLLGLLFVSGWLLFAGVRRLYRWLRPRAAHWGEVLLHWASRNPRLGRVLDSLVDPRRPEAPGLIVSAALLVGGAWLFLGVAQGVAGGDPLVQFDHALYHLLQGLRSPIGDTLMVAVTELGDAAVTLPVTLGVLVWLLSRRAWHSALYWGLAVGSGALLVALVKGLFRVPRPLDLYDGLSSFSFPSGHATTSLVLYGFLAFLISRGLRPQRCWWPFAAAAPLVGTIGFSRLYLGAHWLSDVLAGFGLGLAWTTLLGVAYQRHGLPRRPLAGLAPVSLALLAVAAGWHIHDRHAADMARYQRKPPERVLSETDWMAGGWRTLPAHRLDLEGEREQALDLQYAGPLGRLESALAATGWQLPPAWSLSSVLAWLTPTTPVTRLPLLPQVHDGRHQSLLMIRPLAADPDALAVLRLWPADARTASGVPLWLGSVTRLRLPVVLGLGRLPRPGGNLPAEETIGVPPGIHRAPGRDGEEGPLLLITAEGGEGIEVTLLEDRAPTASGNGTFQPAYPSLMQPGKTPEHFENANIRHPKKIKIPELRRVNCAAMNGLGRSPRPVPKRSRDSVAPGGFVFKARQGAHTRCM